MSTYSYRRLSETVCSVIELHLVAGSINRTKEGMPIIYHYHQLNDDYITPALMTV